MWGEAPKIMQPPPPLPPPLEVGGDWCWYWCFGVGEKYRRLARIPPINTTLGSWGAILFSPPFEVEGGASDGFGAKDVQWLFRFCRFCCWRCWRCLLLMMCYSGIVVIVIVVLLFVLWRWCPLCGIPTTFLVDDNSGVQWLPWTPLILNLWLPFFWSGFHKICCCNIYWKLWGWWWCYREDIFLLVCCCCCLW